MSHAASRRDVCAGLFVAAIGGVAILEGRTHGIGTLLRMGTGFFPIILGVILILLGAAIAITAVLKTEIATTDATEHVEPPDWRGCGAIVGGIVLFIVLGEFGGLAPATFGLVFAAALGDRQSTWLGALVLAFIMTLMAGVLFWYLLQVQFPIWRLGGE